MKYISILILSCFVPACVYDPPGETFTVFNNSDSAIYIYYGCADSIELRPELVLFEEFVKDGKKYKTSPNYRINANSQGNILAFGNRKNFIENCTNHTVKIFFIKESIMLSRRWKEIVASQLYTKKEEFNYEELEKLDWTVKYDPE